MHRSICDISFGNLCETKYNRPEDCTRRSASIKPKKVSNVLMAFGT